MTPAAEQFGLAGPFDYQAAVVDYNDGVNGGFEDIFKAGVFRFKMGDTLALPADFLLKFGDSLFQIVVGWFFDHFLSPPAFDDGCGLPLQSLSPERVFLPKGKTIINSIDLRGNGQAILRSGMINCLWK